MYEVAYNGPDTVEFYCDECESDSEGWVDDLDGSFVGVTCEGCGDRFYVEIF